MRECGSEVLSLSKSAHVDHPGRPNLDWLEDEVSSLLSSRRTFRNVFRATGVARSLVDPADVHPRHCALYDLC